MTRAPLVALALAGAAWPQPSRAEIYRYESADGTITFTTEPRPGERPTTVYTTPEQPRTPPAGDAPGPGAARAPDVFDPFIQQAADAYGVPFPFIKAVIRVESAFDPSAVSHAGALGLMQLLPATALEFNCVDPFDPQQNIMAGVQYLQYLMSRYRGDLNLVLAAYNAGPGVVGEFDGIPYEATRRYIQRVYEYCLGYGGCVAER